MIKSLFVGAAAALFLFLPTSAKAAPEHYSFDKAHTQILFFVNHLGFSMSQGEFHDYDGHFIFDRENPENSSVEVEIRAESIDMDDEKWDTHMKNEDFFHVTKYPVITFKSTKIEQFSEDSANITGDLTMLGVTKPVTLTTTLNKTGRHPFNQKYVAGFSATATVKRSDFGMNYGLPLIGDEAQIRLEIEGIRKDEEGQGPVSP